MKLSFLVLALGPVVVAGCGDGDDNGVTPPAGGGEITFPLKVGNEWTFFSETTTGLRAEEETVTVTDTEDFRGETYYVLETTFAADPEETSEIWLRQEGQTIQMVPDVSDFAPGGLPIPQFIFDRVTASLPWQFADFDASSGTQWTLTELDTTATIDIPPFGQLEDAQIDLSITASSQGRESVTVPAGTYSDAYKGQLVIAFTVGEPPLSVAFTSMQTFWTADGVGLVKEVDQSSTSTETRTSVLESYALE